jgi:hypothetical protein
MPWDYSIYSDLNEEQKNVFTEAGETLFMIQTTESTIQNCLIFALKDENITFEQVFSEEKATRKKTLGQITKIVQKRIALHPQFYKMLSEFVEQRNHFAHQVFIDNKYNLSNKEECKKLQNYLRIIQDNAWNIDKVFWGYLLHWMKETGVYDHMPQEFKENKHLKQVEQNSFHLLFQKPGTKLTHFVRIKKK